MPHGLGEHLLAASLLDVGWLDRVGLTKGQPVLLILEGVCPYLPQAPLEALLATLAILVWHVYFVILDPSIYPLKSLKHQSTYKR